MSVTTLQRILKKGICKMSVYEALSLMITFATLIVLVNNNKDNKK
ncbi:MAG TPA: putative holin-like toxin [Enterococcus cecorum]|nr:putative holin-like toxin [Enterococcus cecorum]